MPENVNWGLLIAIMCRHGCTEQQIAYTIGVCPSSVSNIFNGKVINPRYTSCARLYNLALKTISRSELERCCS